MTFLPDDRVEDQRFLLKLVFSEDFLYENRIEGRLLPLNFIEGEILLPGNRAER